MLSSLWKDESSVESLFCDVMAGKINLTDSSVPHHVVFAYMILFYMHYGKQSPEYQRFKNGILTMNNHDYEWLGINIEQIFKKDLLYRSWQDQPEGLAFSTYVIPRSLKILVLGDWATGLPQGEDLLQKAMGFQPDLFLHLGDTYYSGTREEQEAYFLRPLQKYLLLRLFLLSQATMISIQEGKVFIGYWIKSDKRRAFSASKMRVGVLSASTPLFMMPFTRIDIRIKPNCERMSSSG